MRNYILIGMLFLVSCNKPDCSNGIKDGIEEEIDCGGDCTPCLIEEEEKEPSELLKKLWKTWYKLSLTTYMFGATATVETDTSCKVELTNQLQFVPQSPYPIFKMYGSFGCSYPDENTYSVSEDLMLVSSYDLESVDSTSLFLSYYDDNQGYYEAHKYSANSPNYSTNEAVYWEVNFPNGFSSGPGYLKIVISENNGLFPDIQIDVDSTKDDYYGVLYVDPADLPSIRMRLHEDNGVAVQPNVEFVSKLRVGEVEVVRSFTAPLSNSVGYLSIHSSVALNFN